jgi:hypothetical protein
LSVVLIHKDHITNSPLPTLLHQIDNKNIKEIADRFLPITRSRIVKRELIVETKGVSTLNKLKNNGNIQETFNMNDEEFTRQWFAFVKEKYGM